jgi:2-keto-3-deoxy-L-fuconate dehydrogenase
MSNFRLDQKVAIITGGGSGIGKSIAETFAENGAYVHLLEINEETGRRTVEGIHQSGFKGTFHLCDIRNQASVVKTVGEIQKTHPINILVNNAGVAQIGNVEQTPEAAFDRVYQVNVKGVYNCLYACIPHFRKNGGGVILNMASVVSWVGIPDRFAYSMSKGAVWTMTLSVAMDYIKDNIRCNSISPARVHTPFVDGYLAEHYPGREKEIYEQLAHTQPIGRMAEPKEVADLALFLCSEEAGFITGSDYAIDGGFIKINN